MQDSDIEEDTNFLVTNVTNNPKIETSVISIQKQEKPAKKFPGVASYSEYLKKRPENEEDTFFYMEVADSLFEIRQYTNSIHVLSNISEISIQEPQPLRI